MDDSETYIKMSDCPEIQKVDTYHWADKDSELQQVHQLDKRSYYAVTDRESGRFFPAKSFAYDHTSNTTVHGYVNTRNLTTTVGCAVRSDLPVAYKWDEVIWLPRQDQLQAMINQPTSWALLWWFTDWAKVEGMKGSIPETASMEQLWLAFVMKENHNKIWNSTEWVKGGHK